LGLCSCHARPRNHTFAQHGSTPFLAHYRQHHTTVCEIRALSEAALSVRKHLGVCNWRGRFGRRHSADSCEECCFAAKKKVRFSHYSVIFATIGSSNILTERLDTEIEPQRPVLSNGPDYENSVGPAIAKQAFYTAPDGRVAQLYMYFIYHNDGREF
jgi:hypothetical protein